MSLAIDPSSQELNFVVVNGVQSPGRAQLTQVKAPYNWDVQPGYGLSGARTIYRGRGIAKPQLTLAFWEREHFIAWPAFRKLIEPPKTSKPFVVQMRHPLLSDAEIEAVSVESIGAPERAPGGGLWLVQIQLIEYRPPAPVLVKPRGAIPSPEKGKPLTPKTEADIALAEAIAAKDAAKEAARNAGRR